MLDQNGNFIGDLQVDPEKPAVGVALNADELAGTLQKEVIRAEVNGGKCRSFTGESVPFFDSPSDVGEVLSSVIVPEKGSVISASVELDLTHPRAGSAGISLIFGDESAEKPHIVLKEGCDPNSMSCDHFGKNMVNVLFSDEATSDFPEDEVSVPYSISSNSILNITTRAEQRTLHRSIQTSSASESDLSRGWRNSWKRWKFWSLHAEGKYSWCIRST